MCCSTMNNYYIIQKNLHCCSTTNNSSNFFVNNNNKVDHNNLQMMCYIYFYSSPIDVSNIKRKRLISYYNKNGIITFNKHANANHAIIAKMFKEIYNPLRKTI